MSFIFSQAAVVAFSPATSLDTGASAPSKSSHTPKPSLWHDKTMDASRLSRYGMTCSPLDPNHGQALLTSFMQAFRVPTSAPLEKAQDSTESSPVFTGKSQGSFAQYDPLSSSWKTPQLSLAGDLEPFSGTWPRWGLMRAGACWELDMSDLPTSATGPGSLPTPSGTSNHGKNHVCGRLDEWGGSSNRWRKTEIGKVSCPPFEEWVMEWPVQWTELTASAMDRFREWQQQHGEFSPPDEQQLAA